MSSDYEKVDAVRRMVDATVAVLINKSAAVSILEHAESDLRAMCDNPETEVPRARLLEAADFVAEAIAIIPKIGDELTDEQEEVLMTAVGTLEDLRNAC